ncbi:MAG TPA: hypothetical protein VGF94_08415 [Kofleriaceae bacterium]|jgi:hypothetical protein
MGKKLHAREIASDHLDEILKLVRRDGQPENDFMLTNDDLDEVERAVKRSKGRERT